MREMRSRTLVVALLGVLAAGGGACSSSDPHEVVSCDPSWRTNPEFTFDGDRCERACAAPSATESTSCHAVEESGNSDRDCFTTFVVDGVRGCCRTVVDGGLAEMAFYVCDP